MNKLFIAFAAFLFSASLSAQNLNMTLRSQRTYPGQTLANIWGHVDSLGNEYALVGASGGLSIVNVTNPDSIWEVDQIPGPNNLWKEVKTWGGFAYVTTEASGVQGLQIIDLRNLPGTNIPSKYWGPMINGVQLTTIHALHIDNGYAYLYGCNGNGSPLQGVVIANLSDPWNPTVAGVYGQTYIHDGYVRNDTLYAGHIYNGYFSVMDVTNKAMPTIVETQNTPGNFTHNTWLTDNSKVLLTTDETDYSYLTSYDITDVSNITELDRFQVTPGSGSVVHNTHVLNDYAVTSWYKDGVVTVDAHRPENLVKVGRYDTYSGSGTGMEGNWGVYPFLPSGNLIATGIDEGLFVITPTYVRAAYLEGMITDSICGTPIFGARITISSVNVIDSSNSSGVYKTGTAVPGTYTITVSKTGYQTRTITGVVLTAAQVTNLNVKLFSTNTVSVSGTTKTNNVSIGNIPVQLKNATNTFNITSNASGVFSACNIIAGTYTVTAAKWGYRTYCTTVVVSSGSVLNIDLQPQIYDDFTVDNGWTVTGNSSSGAWVRGEPVGTDQGGIQANPEEDDNTDCSDLAYITGNGGGGVGSDDVDNGYTILSSPVFDLTNANDPYLNYSRWFFNGFGSSQANDSMFVMITNGTTTVVLETMTDTSIGEGEWVFRSFKLDTFLSPSSTMQIMVKAVDAAPGHVVEGGFDKFEITSGSPASVYSRAEKTNIMVYPNPFTEQFNIAYDLNGKETAIVHMYDSRGAIVYETKLNSEKGTEVISRNLSKGIYLVRVSSGSEVQTFRIVKN